MSERMRRLASCCACLALVATGCPSEEPAQPAGGGPSFEPFTSCAAVANYADELLLSSFALVRETDLGNGIAEVEIAFAVDNASVGAFSSAQATPDFSGLDLELVADFDPVPADIPAVAANGAAVSASNLVLRLPSARIGELLGELDAGRVPFTVRANESTVLAPNVEIAFWSSLEERYWVIATDILGILQDPPPPPYAPGEEFSFTLVETRDEAESIFDGFQPGDLFYVRESDTVPLTAIPPVLHNVRVVDVQKSNEAGQPDGSTTWGVTVALTDQDALPQLVTSGSFCTGPESHVDLPVQASRLFEMDGDPTEEAERDSFVQPLRFNDLPFADGAVTVSGQIQGHVLKPSVQLRLRDGVVLATTDFDTDLSLTAEVRAERTVDVDPDPFFLYDLCFPLPDLVAGPVSIPMNLQLAHWVDFDGSLTAGAVVGIQKRFQNGFTVGFDGGRDPGERYFSEGRNEQPTPVEFTPPRLTEETSANARVSTAMRTTLRVGARHPFCDTGVGAYLEAGAYGSLDVEPTEDPWWSLGHGAHALAGIELTLFGLGIAHYEAPLVPFPGRETRTASDAGGGGGAAPGGPAPPRDSGEDQRWAVAIDDIDVPNAFEVTSVGELSDGSIVVASQERVTGGNRLVRLDRWGAFQWSLKYRNVKQPRRVLVLPDDRILVAGETAWLALHDAQGNLLWNREYEVGDASDRFAICRLRDAALVEEDDGQFGVIAAGVLGRNPVPERDACAFRVDPDGELVWARTFSEPGAHEFYGVTATSDGRFVMVGQTETGPDPFSINNPLVVSMTGAGELLWAKSLPMASRIGRWNEVVEGPEGVLLLAGEALRSIRQSGAALAGRIASDGSDARHALLFEDEAWEALLDFGTTADTAGGETAYDAFTDIVPVAGGYVVAGKTGLGVETAAWAARLNANLGTEWFTTFDGDGLDFFDAAAASADGILLSGRSDSLPAPEIPGRLWVAKLPFTGAMRFLPETGITIRYVEPGVRWSSADDRIVLSEASVDAPFTVAAATLAESEPIDDLLVEPSRLCVTRLTETGRDSDLDACESSSDTDGDGVLDAEDNCLEASNAEQRDTDRDGYGNRCDPDYNDDGLVGIPDFNALRAQFGNVETDPDYDDNVELTGDGAIGIPDFNVLNALFGLPPGPSGLDCAGTAPCP